MEREYSLEDAVTFAISNEAETLKGEEQLGAAQNAYGNAAFYADQYGYTVEEFRAELRKRGAR